MVKKEETAIEMFVGGLVLDPNTQAPVVVLKDEEGKIHLPIWIGIAEATSIASAIKDVSMARPLTHDLMTSVLGELGARIERVVLTELKDSTYYSELLVTLGDQIMIFDSRPSDAIALALRASAPIFVAPQVLEQAQITFAQSEIGKPTTETGVANPEGEEEGESNPDKDFKNIDKEKWEKLLEELDLEDFKYKM